MEYTIGQVAKLTGLSISTIRYYDKEGLLNGINRKSGIRSFNDKDLNTIRVIECLKNSGMLIKEIRDFMKLCEEGDSSLNERYNFFLDQEKKVQDQIKSLNQTLKLIKLFYYRGLNEWKNEKGYLRDTCLTAQDKFKTWLDYFQIPYKN